jgi:hypothetical protein
MEPLFWLMTRGRSSILELNRSLDPLMLLMIELLFKLLLNDSARFLRICSS